MLTRGVWLLHDNAPNDKSMIAQQAVRDCGFVQLDHPAYSPDLAPSDYFLFRNLSCGFRYPDDEALKEAVKEWLEGQTEEFYLVELTVCQKNVANAVNSVVIILKNKVQFVCNISILLYGRDSKLFERPSYKEFLDDFLIPTAFISVELTNYVPQ